MTDLWSYRTPTGEIITLERVWDDDAGDWAYVTRNDSEQEQPSWHA